MTVSKSQQPEEKVEEAVEIKEEDENKEEEATKSETPEAESPSDKDESETGTIFFSIYFDCIIHDVI